MSFKRITLMDVYEIVRRWHDQQSVSQIARELGYDRKTIRKYIHYCSKIGLSQKEPLPAKQWIINSLAKVIPAPQRPATAQQVLKPFLSEITQLIHDKHHPLKPKHAFEVICQRHQLNGKVSYSTFKNFYRRHVLTIDAQKITCRIESPPGKEIQVDYARVGYLYDPLNKRKKVVYGFIATLAFSRHKYIEFTFKQDQQSFVNSHVNMFDRFDGVPHTVNIDNLKNGVIKPDLYDPRFNRTYQEMAEYYGFFINPCRVKHPKDKGKVERDVQFVRQLFRKLIALYPDATINELNRRANAYLINDYGQKPHGTTGRKPYVAFLETEKPALKPLPQHPFEIAVWKQAKVHPDLYVQFNKKFYSVPYQYAGKLVWIKATAKIVKIYFQHQLIKQHLITDNYRHTDINDFPPNVKAALDEGLPARLQHKARLIGANFQQLVRKTLELHTFINLRNAQGLVALADKFDHQIIEKTAAFFIEHNIAVNYRLFKQKLEQMKQQQAQSIMPISQQSLQFVREMDYFCHQKS